MAVAPCVRSREPVCFADPALRKAVERQLGISEPDAADMLGLTDLHAEKQGIVDLTGLEYALKLRVLNLNGNHINDISVLSELVALEFVDLANNRIKSIPELSRLKNLTWLILYNNRFEDISTTSRQVNLDGAVVVFYEGNRDPNLAAPELSTAIARADNDYVYEEPYKSKGDAVVNLPFPVRDKICEVTLREFLSNFYETIEPKKYSDLFGPVFRINIPGREHLHLYIYKLYTVMHYYDFVLILHDERNEKVTLNSICFSGRWIAGAYMAAPMKPPFVDFDDLNLDGNPEIVFKERIHNGTELNAVVHHFLHINEDLSLKPIFCLEARSYHDCFNQRRPGYLIRAIEKQGPNRIFVRVSVSTDPFLEGKKKIGHVILESNSLSSPFTVKKKIMHIDEKDAGSWYETYERLLLHTWLSPYR